MKHAFILMCFVSTMAACANEQVWRPPPMCAGRSGEALAQCETGIDRQLRDDSPGRQFGPIQPSADFDARLFQYRNEVYEFQHGRLPDFDGGVSDELIHKTIHPAPPPTASSDSR